MTFSNPEMAILLNENFICTWENRRPGFHNCEFMTEQAIAKNPIFATQNFATFFLTPEDGVLHYMAGYFHPDFFRREVEFVMDLRKRFLDRDCRFRTGAYPGYQALHREVGRLLMDEIELPKDSRQEWAIHNVNDGLRHLAQVHQFLGKARANLLPMSKLRKSYLSANPFTEEDSRPNQGRPTGGKAR